MTTDRTDFNNTWLMESPEGLGSFEMFDALEYNIRDRKKHGGEIASLGNNLYKIRGEQVLYYWYEKDGKILLGCELSIRPQAMTVNMVGKNPKHRGSAPYASDLYAAILKDNSRSIVVSDTQLSDEGYNIWKRLVRKGFAVSVYDSKQPGKSFKTFRDEAELDEFFKDDDTDYRRYQYVLSSEGEVLAETRSYFNTRRYRELAGLSLKD